MAAGPWLFDCRARLCMAAGNDSPCRRRSKKRNSQLPIFEAVKTALSSLKWGVGISQVNCATSRILTASIHANAQQIAVKYVDTFACLLKANANGVIKAFLFSLGVISAA